jgi:hypothetical protein
VKVYYPALAERMLVFDLKSQYKNEMSKVTLMDKYVFSYMLGRCQNQNPMLKLGVMISVLFDLNLSCK